MTVSGRRFRPPRSVEDNGACFGALPLVGFGLTVAVWVSLLLGIAVVVSIMVV